MKTVVLTFDDTCRSHLEIAVPVLKQYGFRATFFASFPGVWYQDIPEAHLKPEECAELHKQGFEVGNHTMNHPDLRQLEDSECRNEIMLLNEILVKNGIPSPVSHAYPGGPYAANAAAILPDCGIRFARTTEHALWTAETDPLRIPCYSINSGKQESNFREGLDLLGDREDAALVLLYHGVPDLAHPQCSTDAELFRAHMKYLSENGYRVVSMSDYGEMLNGR